MNDQMQVQVINALKRAYQKHALHDESIGDEELSDEMAAALVAVLGDDGFFFWLESVCKK